MYLVVQSLSRKGSSCYYVKRYRLRELRFRLLHVEEPMLAAIGLAGLTNFIVSDHKWLLLWWMIGYREGEKGALKKKKK